MVNSNFGATRLPSNLRPITSECVHFVTRGHFRSRDKDVGHITRPLYPKTQCYMQTSRLYVLENRSYCWWKFYIAGIGMLFLWPWPDDLLIRTWPYSLEVYWICKYELPMSRLFKVIVWQTERLYTTQLREWSKL